MNARNRRHEMDIPLRWPVVAVILFAYFLTSGVLGAALGQDVARMLDGIVPSLVVASLSAGALTTAAGLALARADVLILLVTEIRFCHSTDRPDE